MATFQSRLYLYPRPEKTHNSVMDIRCHIGLPQWQHSHWHADRPDGLKALQRYANCFSSVEGNTSFYGAPKHETLLRWLDNTPAHFKFCFKVPRSISHDAPLHRGGAQLAEFLSGLEIAQERLGIIWLQLSDKIGPESLPALATLFAQLPTGFQYGLEVRHLAFLPRETPSENSMLCCYSTALTE